MTRSPATVARIGCAGAPISWPALQPRCMRMALRRAAGPSRLVSRRGRSGRRCSPNRAMGRPGSFPHWIPPASQRPEWRPCRTDEHAHDAVFVDLHTAISAYQPALAVFIDPQLLYGIPSDDPRRVTTELRQASGASGRVPHGYLHQVTIARRDIGGKPGRVTVK